MTYHAKLVSTQPFDMIGWSPSPGYRANQSEFCSDISFKWCFVVIGPHFTDVIVLFFISFSLSFSVYIAACFSCWKLFCFALIKPRCWYTFKSPAMFVVPPPVEIPPPLKIPRLLMVVGEKGGGVELGKQTTGLHSGLNLNLK